jgi:hypothetical protein
MKYSLFFYHQNGTDVGLTEEDMAPWRAAFTAYTEALTEAGAFVSMDALQPPESATTITLKDGSLQIQDGPYADTKEYLGGYYVISVPDLDAALAWAEKCPAAQWGYVEIRPSGLPG